MSTPQDASTTRQRNPRLEDETPNPASLSADPTKRVQRNKPVVKPPFADVSMNKFLVYLLLGVLTIVGFYIWRVRAPSEFRNALIACRRLQSGHRMPEATGS